MGLLSETDLVSASPAGPRACVCARSGHEELGDEVSARLDEAQADRGRMLMTQTDSVRVETLERLRVLIVAGISVGVLVAGVGSRLAMFVLRLTSPHSVRGIESDDGFIIGRFTLGGTYNLLILGAFVGIIGAAAYRAVSPWLFGPGWFQRLTVAAGCGAVVGSMLVHGSGIDFRFLKPLWLAVGLFVALPALFGVAMGIAVDRVSAPGHWTSRGRLRWILPVGLLLAFPQSMIIAALAALVLVVWVPVRRSFAHDRGVPLAARLVVRSVWLLIAVLGLVALLGDIGDLT